jgi:broad specificity phosphatase PhoE
MRMGRARRWTFLLLAGLLESAAALDIVIVRHAETLANVTKDYSAFNQRHFTARGEQQIARLTRTLAGLRFDAILTSPAYRVMRTIEPYLVASDSRAEIWPELEECCWQRDRAHEYTPPGRPILIEADQKPFFVLRAGASDRTPGSELYDDGLKRVRWVAGEIWRRWAGTDAVLLVATHYHTGARLIEALIEQPHDGLRLENAKLTHVREVDGRFYLMGVNLDALDLETAAEAKP